MRPHWTLGTLLPASNFHATTSATTADRVLFFDNSSWQTHWLCQTITGARWITGASLIDTASRIIDEGEGLMVHPRGGSLVIPMIGQIRTVPFAPRPSADARLLGETAFRASVLEGDSVKLWSGDTTPGSSSYRVFTKTATGWLDENGNTVPATTPISSPFQAGFAK